MESPSPCESFLETSAHYLEKTAREPSALLRPMQKVRDTIIDDFHKRIARLKSAITENKIQNAESQQKIERIQGREYTDSLDLFERLTTHHNLAFNPENSTNITRVYRELQRRYHQDKGGDSQISAQINAARDILLEGIETRPCLSEIKSEIAYRVQQSDEYKNQLQSTFKNQLPALIPYYSSQVIERLRKKRRLQNLFKTQQPPALNSPSINHQRWTNPESILPGYKPKFTRQIVGGLTKLGLINKMKHHAQEFLDKLNDIVVKSGVSNPAFFSLPGNAFFLFDSKKTNTTELPEELFEKTHTLVPNLTQLTLLCHLEALPNTIRLFEKLETLDLEGNNLKTLPEWLLTLPHLQLLNLQNNPLEMNKSLQKLLNGLTKKGVKVIL